MELRNLFSATRLRSLSAWLLGAIFLYAGIIKASSSQQFLIGLLPFLGLADWLGPLAMALPWVEIAAGLLMFTPWRRWGACVIFLLCLIFCAALGWALANGIIIDCGCFGRDETPSAGKMALAMGRDVLLAGLAFFVLYAPFGRQSGH